MYKDLLGKIKKENAVVFVLLGVLLLVIAIPTEEKKHDTQTNDSEQVEISKFGLAGSEDVTEIAEQFGELLSQVSGAGKTRVMLRYYSDGVKIVEKDESTGDGGSRREVQTIYEKNGGGEEKPFLRESISPTVTGVIVVAEGGDNPVLQKEITEAAVALFGIEPHKIKVMKMA